MKSPSLTSSLGKEVELKPPEIALKSDQTVPRIQIILYKRKYTGE